MSAEQPITVTAQVAGLDELLSKSTPCGRADKLELELKAMDASFKGVLKQRNAMARAIESMQTRAHVIIKLTSVVEVLRHAQGIVHRWTEDPPKKYEQETP